ncbi:hypothetical protein O6V14_09235 [Sphingomonas faeni]|uniref:hypothetical protein n=1 Tax=Sphingomonas TaxID=13687 RepID=UPI002FDFFA94
MKVGPADRAGRNLDDCIAGMLDLGIRNSIDPNIAFSMPNQCAHQNASVIELQYDAHARQGSSSDMTRQWRKCRPIIVNTMHCHCEVSAATQMRRRRQRERILGSIAIRTASSFLLKPNICHLYFILIGINIDMLKLKCSDDAKNYA